VDYLLKPFSGDRLQEALTRVRQRLALPATRPRRPVPLTSGRQAPGPRASWSGAAARLHVVPIDRIDYVEAQDDYVALHTSDRTLLKEQTSRISRRRSTPDGSCGSSIVLLNLDRLVRLEPTGKDSRLAVLRDGTRLPVSRTGYTRLQTLL